MPLLKVATPLDEEGNRALHVATFSDSSEIIQLLLDNGADINITDDKGRTPLMFAAAIGRTECVRLLLERGADKTIKDKNSNPVIAYAKKFENAKIIELLNDAEVTDPLVAATPELGGGSTQG